VGNSFKEAFLNGGGGIVFTSGSGQSQEKRIGFNADGQPENIDFLMAVIGAASSAASSERTKKFLELFKQTLDATTIAKDIKENVVDKINQENGKPQKPDSTHCGTCERNVSNKDTINHVLRPVNK
jgi:hypothetical protein